MRPFLHQRGQSSQPARYNPSIRPAMVAVVIFIVSRAQLLCGVDGWVVRAIREHTPKSPCLFPPDGPSCRCGRMWCLLMAVIVLLLLTLLLLPLLLLLLERRLRLIRWVVSRQN